MEQINTIYIGYYFKVKPLQPAVEILIAELGYAGFESFVETEQGVSAYIQKADWKETILNEIRVLESPEFEIKYSFEEIEQTNWNEEWEKNFNPIIVGNRCSVRAPFHNKPDTEYDIVIEPKMSFGTGHHETTHMMIQNLLNLDVKGKSVLDMGCGTGVLAILAAKKGAHPIEAIDIDNWCYINTMENIERNQTSHIKVYQGDSSLLLNKRYDVIIANINRNVLLNDIKVYSECLNTNGVIVLSGFYTEDLELIRTECESRGLQFKSKLDLNNWISAIFYA